MYYCDRLHLLHYFLISGHHTKAELPTRKGQLLPGPWTTVAPKNICVSWYVIICLISN